MEWEMKIKVTGCANCPAFHDEVGNGTWCAFDEKNNFTHPVRDELNSQFPACPSWCPLQNGGVEIEFSEK
jgi:hypothetical protein